MLKAADPKPTVVRGTSRRLPIPSCSLTADELRRLFRILDKKAQEAAGLQVAPLQRQANQSAEEFKVLKENICSSMKLMVRVQGGTGEWTAATSTDALDDDALPDRIVGVVFDSAFLFRGAFNMQPQNGFTLNLDFSRTSILDMTNLALEPGEGGSFIEISGVNDGWVKSTFDEVRTFFDDRKRTARGLLHSRFSYDLLVLVLGFPTSFALVYRIDRALSPHLQLPSALFVALYVYFVLVALFAFRITFNYAKWVFPKIEGPTRLQGGPVFHKVILSAIGLTLLSLVIETFLRMVGIP